MRLLFLLFFISLVVPAIGQKNDLYPDLYNTYFYNPGLINPAYIAREGKAEVYVFYKHRTGIFQKIASYSVTGSRTFRTKSKSAHLIRAIITNENQGPYIATTRGYANYAYQVPLSENTALMAGAAVGLAQVAFSAPSATATGSYKSPDGSLGLMLRSNNLEAGASMMQIFNSVTEPLITPISLKRYYNFFVSHGKDLSPFVKLQGNILWQLLPSTKDNLVGNILLSYKESISFGSGIGTKSGLNFFMRFNIPIEEEDKLAIVISYNSAFSSIPVDALELNISYLFK